MPETTSRPVPESVLDASADAHVALPITGMTCAACARRIERRLTHAPGVRQAHVNFATKRATVAYDPRETDVRALVKTVEAVGYGVLEPPRADVAISGDDQQAAAERAEVRDLWRRFIVAALLSAPVLLIAMSHGRIALFNVRLINWVQLALTLPVIFYSGWPFYRGAWTALRHRAADLNTLIRSGS